MITHQEKLNSVIDQVKRIASLKQPIKISKAVDSHFVPNPYDKRNKLPKVDLSQMTEILEINQADMTCTAESGVTFSELVRETLKYGLIPYTVPNLRVSRLVERYPAVLSNRCPTNTVVFTIAASSMKWSQALEMLSPVRLKIITIFLT